MRSQNILVAIALVVVGTGAGLACTPATANPVVHQAFAEQARDLGLTDVDTLDLQRQVEATIAVLGGRQVAINKIELDGTGFVLLSLPGESHARDLGTGSAAGAAGCPYLYLCVFKGTNFTGTMIGYTSCEPDDMPWHTTGSYVNNQTAGTVGRFTVLDDQGEETISRTGPAYFEKSSWNWAGTYAIDPC